MGSLESGAGSFKLATPDSRPQTIVRGVSQVEFLVVLLLFCLTMAIGWPYLMRSNNASAEGKATNTLKQIHLAQQDFYGGRRYYGSEQQLRDFGVLNIETKDPPSRAAVGLQPVMSYSFDIQVSGARTKWCAAAIPSTKGRTIAIDETGTVMYGRTCYDGLVQ